MTSAFLIMYTAAAFCVFVELIAKNRGILVKVNSEKWKTKLFMGPGGSITFMRVKKKKNKKTSSLFIQCNSS